MPPRKPQRSALEEEYRPEIDTYEQARLLFMLEEYKQIKQENLVSISSMQSTLSFGLTGISLLIAALTQLYRSDKTVAEAILLIMAPAILVVIERVWSAEVIRLGRASYFLSLVEPEINAYFAKRGVPGISSNASFVRFTDTLHWETWVRGANQTGKTSLMRRNYQVVLWFLIGLAIAAIGAGNLLLWTTLNTPTETLIRWIVSGVSLVAAAGLALEGRWIWSSIMRAVQGGWTK